MTTQTTKYETGATTHAVNDLILFTDNTRELAELRDKIYRTRLCNAKGVKMGFKTINPLLFKPLFEAAIEAYKWEFKDYKTWSPMFRLERSQIAEYCRLYADDFNNWKQEHSIN